MSARKLTADEFVALQEQLEDGKVTVKHIRTLDDLDDLPKEVKEMIIEQMNEVMDEYARAKLILHSVQETRRILTSRLVDLRECVRKLERKIERRETELLEELVAEKKLGSNADERRINKAAVLLDSRLVEWQDELDETLTEVELCEIGLDSMGEEESYAWRVIRMILREREIEAGLE
jgi:hypothetical protein